MPAVYKLLLTVIFSLLTFSQAGAVLPVTIGQKIPHSLQTLDQQGKKQSFNTLKGEKGLVLAFIRSVDWCPYCKKQVVAFNGILDEFAKRGYRVAALSYDPPAKSKPFSDVVGVKFPILSDEGSKIISRFGILDVSHKPGSRFYGVPHPMIYVVDKQGVVTHIFSEEGYKKRPDLHEVLEALR